MLEICKIGERVFMRATGYVRKIDREGRVVLPTEIRSKHKITREDFIEIFVKENFIVLKKLEPKCIFCGDTTTLVEYIGKMLCRKCVNKVSMLESE
ncbi:MAG: AbrB/MazE/SpoVT family DNA-binding domain-containing protein [Oscillospiraceae bacterium]|nr:AbrB/MazE/SpoVT family DNA-binding domain-containing protein [Oscillospiraceae bacterium]